MSELHYEYLPRHGNHKLAAVSREKLSDPQVRLTFEIVMGACKPTSEFPSRNSNLLI
jgi:hypothetical protein